ncbi:hypothetical protein KBC99_00015 [Candidatus Saccharibacteria bacterium]|nr:hypothetical protein [Candidatus Saccharibacteria bacterium]
MPFYEVQTSNDDHGIVRTSKPECYLSEVLAAFQAKGASWWGGDGKVVQIFVLVAEGDTDHGIALSGLNAAKKLTLRNEQEERLSAIATILSKLTPEERAILGHQDS